MIVHTPEILSSEGLYMTQGKIRGTVNLTKTKGKIVKLYNKFELVLCRCEKSNRLFYIEASYHTMRNLITNQEMKCIIVWTRKFGIPKDRDMTSEQKKTVFTAFYANADRIRSFLGK